MKSHVIVINRTGSDRRRHVREGALAQIEDVTYRILRKYGINGGAEQRVLGNLAENSAVA
jgi:hypothetical protein